MALGRDIPGLLLSPEDEDLLDQKWTRTSAGRYLKKCMNSRHRLMHHVVWHRMTGQWPSREHGDIDHIDGDGLNNRRDNLRQVTHQQNGQNRRHRPHFTRGVHWVKAKKKYVAYAHHNYRRIYIGYFHDKDEAAEAAAAKRRELGFLEGAA